MSEDVTKFIRGNDNDIPIIIDYPESKTETKEYPTVGYHNFLYSRLSEKTIAQQTRFEYLRKKYSKPTFFGRRVRKGNDSGMICGCDGDYIVVRIYNNVVFWLPDQVEYL